MSLYYVNKYKIATRYVTPETAKVINIFLFLSTKKVLTDSNMMITLGVLCVGSCNKLFYWPTLTPPQWDNAMHSRSLFQISKNHFISRLPSTFNHNKREEKEEMFRAISKDEEGVGKGWMGSAEKGKGDKQEIGSQAVWSLSSAKPGFGVEQLRDDNIESYWQYIK